MASGEEGRTAEVLYCPDVVGKSGGRMELAGGEIILASALGIKG